VSDCFVLRVVQLDVHDYASELTNAKQWAELHSGGDTRGQADGDGPATSGGQRLGGVGEQCHLVGGVEHGAGVVVQEHHVATHRKHDPAHPTAGP